MCLKSCVTQNSALLVAGESARIAENGLTCGFQMLFRNVRIKFGIRHANLGSCLKRAAEEEEEEVDSRSFGLLLACGSR
jgi:hypothetical protein